MQTAYALWQEKYRIKLTNSISESQGFSKVSVESNRQFNKLPEQTKYKKSIITGKVRFLTNVLGIVMNTYVHSQQQEFRNVLQLTMTPTKFKLLSLLGKQRHNLLFSCYHGIC